MKYFRLVLSGLVLILGTGFGGSSGDRAPIKHHLNYQGELIDAYGKKYSVENISISGQLRGIKIYEKPVSLNGNPADAITRIDLDQIDSLEPAPVQQDNCDRIHRYKGKNYTLVRVTLNDEDKTQQEYLIESHQKLMCDIIIGTSFLEKEFSFSGFKKLTLSGRTERSYKQLYPQTVGNNKE